MARGQRAGRAAPVDGHRGRLPGPPGVGGEAGRGALVGGVVAVGLPRPRGVADRVGDLRGGVLPRRRAVSMGKPGPGLPERHLPARPDPLRPRHPRAAGPVPALDGHRRAGLGPGVVRARSGVRPRLAAVHRHPGRRARWLAAQRPEDVVLAGVVRPLGLRPLPLRPVRPAPCRPDLLPVPARRRRGHGPADRAARRRGRLRRDLPRGRVRARLRRPRSAWRRLAGGHEYGGQRARPVPALPRQVLRGRRPAGRAVARAPRASTRPSGGAIASQTLSIASQTPGSRRRPTGSTPGARSPGWPPAATWAPPARSTRSSGPSWTSPSTRPPSTCSARRPRWSRRGPTGTSSPSRDRSTPAPTRSSATSSPSGSSASPASRKGGGR